MNYVGIDLHKKIYRPLRHGPRPQPSSRRRHLRLCADTARIVAFFASLGPFQAVVEATASYEWLVQRDRAPGPAGRAGQSQASCGSSPRAPRRPTSSTPSVLAEFLARDMIPEAYRPDAPAARAPHPGPPPAVSSSSADHGPEEQDAADRQQLQRRPPRPLQPRAGRRPCWTAQCSARATGSWLDQLHAQWQHAGGRSCGVLGRRLKQFAAEGSDRARPRRGPSCGAIPGVGPVTIDVVVSGAGGREPVPLGQGGGGLRGAGARVRRESAGKGKDLGITKEGSPLLRWALVEAAWRVVRQLGVVATDLRRHQKRAGEQEGDRGGGAAAAGGDGGDAPRVDQDVSRAASPADGVRCGHGGGVPSVRDTSVRSDCTYEESLMTMRQSVEPPTGGRDDAKGDPVPSQAGGSWPDLACG